MNLKQILEMTDKKHEEELIYQKIALIQLERDQEILKATSQIYTKYQGQLKEAKEHLTLRNTCSHELLLKYDTGPDSYDEENYYCICCGQHFNTYNCDENQALKAIKLSKYYHDFDESFHELITDIDSYIRSLYLQNPHMDIEELRNHIKVFVSLKTNKERVKKRV